MAMSSADPDVDIVRPTNDSFPNGGAALRDLVQSNTYHGFFFLFLFNLSSPYVLARVRS